MGVLKVICTVAVCGSTYFAGCPAQTVMPLAHDDGKLVYSPDSLGNRIPDFSYCGYKASEAPVPMAPVRVTVPARAGDATHRIQAAIDYVSRLPEDHRGLRGAVLLQKGTHTVNGSLHLHTSGVVLRGSGTDDAGTVLLGAGQDRTTLVRVAGQPAATTGASFSVANAYVPVNAAALDLKGPHPIQPGDRVAIRRPATKEWIDALGTAHFGGGITSLGWKPDRQHLEWRRTVTAVNGAALTLDAPLTTALDQRFGGATVVRYDAKGVIANCGVENMRMVSEYDPGNPKDEAHRWMAISIDHASDAWVRQVVFHHFAGSAVAVYGNASRITVEDCISQYPVSEIGGQRRITFFTEGQQTLFQRCYAEEGIHDFATGFCAPGPNAFVQCTAVRSNGFSGGLDSWASGVLYDLVTIDGNALRLADRGQDGQGAGWAAANSVLWNCSASVIACEQPPTAQNWAFGSWGQFTGNGFWSSSNQYVKPLSLYYGQLSRRGVALPDPFPLMKTATEASSSPSAAVALELTRQAGSASPSLQEFIRTAGSRQPVSLEASGVSSIDAIGVAPVPAKRQSPPLQVVNGRLIRGNMLLTGNSHSVPWWNGSAKTYALAGALPALTRFVPGKEGAGLTDNLNDLADWMVRNHTVAIRHNHGLWYDRRRDDHARVRRMDGEVWPPFYELPFARSGQGTAWDGMSRYDLTRYNPWYWNRLRQFAGLADERSLVLVHQHYFQHNVLEAGAHYADFPWRPANTINDTGFPEPPPYAGDKRIFLAEQFYDTAHALRRELHRNYIRQCLDNFKENNGVLHLIGEEYTGPLHFVQFWLNTIREWTQETGIKPLIGLSVTKDVQDAILNDPAYASLIDVIEIRYWHYQSDGEVYAPRGGENLAPRQHARLLKPKASSAEQVYRAVSEYRQRYPDKAVLYTAGGWEKNGWAILMAGGSLPNVASMAILEEVKEMRRVKSGPGQWVLRSDATGNVLVYAAGEEPLTIDLSREKGVYQVFRIDTRTGDMQPSDFTVTAGKSVKLPPLKQSEAVWLKKDDTSGASPAKEHFRTTPGDSLRYRVGLIDLMLLKRQKLSAIPLAASLDADGLEVDMGGLGNRNTFQNQLAVDSVRQAYLALAEEKNISLFSLAMTGYYAQSFCNREVYKESIEACIATMLSMGIRHAFLPLGVQCDLRKNPEVRDSVIARLRVVGTLAAEANVVVGIETALSAAEEVALLEEIGSPAIRIYFNVSEPLKAGRDLYEELKILGKDRISMIHASNKDSLLLENDPQVDLYRIKQTLDEMGWSGWLVIERSRDASRARDTRYNYGSNVAYLKKVFQP